MIILGTMESTTILAVIVAAIVIATIFVVWLVGEGFRGCIVRRPVDESLCASRVGENYLYGQL